MRFLILAKNQKFKTGCQLYICFPVLTSNFWCQAIRFVERYRNHFHIWPGIDPQIFSFGKSKREQQREKERERERCNKKED